jgi:hypothetical protein
VARAARSQASAVTALTAAQARALTLRAQGFAARASASPSIAKIVEDHGFVRTLGGTEVYLAVRARRPKLTRKELEAATAKGDVRVATAVRGCMYLVSRRDFRLALAIAEHLSRPRAQREREKAGIEKGELEKLGDRIVKLLGKAGPLSTDALRKQLPDGSVRSLGERGKKIGVSSTLPPALRLLEFDDRIERALETGRLDSERYVWRIADTVAEPAPPDVESVHARLAERFFAWAGVATKADFVEWCGIGKGDAAKAIEGAKLVEVAVEGIDGPCHAPASALDGVAKAVDATKDAVALLPFEDNVVALRGGPRIWVDEIHHDVSVPVWGGSGTSKLGDARHLSLRSIVAEGIVAGFWEYDPAAKSVVTGVFAPIDAKTRERISEEAENVGAFLRDELGHGRSFSLDTDDALAERAAFVRAMGKRAPGKRGAAERAR